MQVISLIMWLRKIYMTTGNGLYRKGKLTEQLLIHLTEKWREAVERKYFVDFTKAFDTVSHNILLQKLNNLGLRGDIWLWLKK